MPVNNIPCNKMIIKQTVWIARHANRQDFVTPEWFNTAQFPYDPPLSADGFIQATELGQRLKSEKISHIFASPFLRTIQTANQVAEALDLSIKLEAGLGEWLNPEWMGDQPQLNPIDIIAQKYSRLDLSYNSKVLPQYPETQSTVEKRTALTAQKLIEEFDEDILLVGHGASVVGSAIGLVGVGTTIRATLCCLVKLVRTSQGWNLELNGDDSHLSQPQKPIRFN